LALLPEVFTFLKELKEKNVSKVAILNKNRQFFCLQAIFFPFLRDLNGKIKFK